MGSIGGEEAIQDPPNYEERILVSVRLRPLNDKELTKNDVSDWECINDSTIIYRNNLPASERSLYPTAYSFDKVFRTDCSTRQVYEEAAKEVALSVVSGINSSIFAYGQTSSGKTYTMSGITEYTMVDIFNYMEKHSEREFLLKFSAIEIYNESVRDLLSPDSTPLRLLDDPERGTVVEKLIEETVRDWEHFAELISFCEAQRQIGETTLNEASSRSHQILRLTVESSAREFLGNDKCSSLSASVNFVDLAGSERASQTNSAGTRLKEGCHINRSLLTLGTVIRKLSKGRNGHIPFRDSKLTRILQSSLGGNARTAIICTMSPARSHVEQTRNTLLFASCAKEVATNAQVNVVMSDKALVKQLQKELARMESELRNSGPARPISDSAALLREKDLQIEMLKKEMKELALQRDLAQAQIKDMIQNAGDNMSSLIGVESFGPRYPKLRVRNSWEREEPNVLRNSWEREEPNVLRNSWEREEPNVLSIDCEESIRSFNASQYSDGHSFSSDDNLFQLNDLEKNLTVKSSPELSVTRFVAIHNDSHQKNIEDQHEEDYIHNDSHQKNTEDQHEQDYCKEVRCIEIENPIKNTHKHSNPEDLKSNTYTDSAVPPSPCVDTSISGLNGAANGDKTNMKSCPSVLKEDKRLNHLRGYLRGYFALSSPESSTPRRKQNNRSSSRSSLKLSRSRSCKASLMRNLSSDWFEDDEIENTPPIGNEKHFAGRPEGFLRKVRTLHYSNGHGNSVENSAVDGIHNVKASTEKENENETSGPLTPRRKEMENLKRLSLLADNEVSGTGLDPMMSAKNVKDVGLDPMQVDGENLSEWPSKFNRLQKEIVELWDACNVSLVHRTYFFLLFKGGDPSDSIYMEVESRRLSYLKQTFSQGKKTLQDGIWFTPESSKRYLRRERQMLCKQMQRRLSKSERENLYLKWGLRLTSKFRRMQMADRLWTDTNDMEHVRESAAIVAKLVGLVEPEQALKEMFGLNFAPRQTSRKSFSWSASVRHLL